MHPIGAVPKLLCGRTSIGVQVKKEKVLEVAVAQWQQYLPKAFGFEIKMKIDASEKLTNLR